MPKATLKFDLPAEQEEFDQTLLARDYFSSLWDLLELLRTIDRHGRPDGYPKLRLGVDDFREIIPVTAEQIAQLNLQTDLVSVSALRDVIYQQVLSDKVKETL